MRKEKQIDIKGMRAYEELSDIHLPIEQEKMMDIICDAWEECRQSDCKVCTDRPHSDMRIMACTALKYTRLLREADYRKQSEGEWIWTESGQEDYEQYWVCSCCHEKDYFEDKFCPNCGAKMKGEQK